MSKGLVWVILLISLLLIIPVNAQWFPGEANGYNITITGPSSWNGNINNYVLLLNVIRSAGTNSGNTLYTSTNCNANYSDLRFTDNANNTLNYWVEDGNTSASATVWVQVPILYKSSPINITSYYGNASFAAVSNPNTTWILYDHFGGSSLNASKWSSAGTVSVANSQVTIGAVSSSVTSLTSYQNNFVEVFNSTRKSSSNYDYFGAPNGQNPYFGASAGVNYFWYGANPPTADGAPDSASRHMILRAIDNSGNYGDYFSINSNTLTGPFYENPSYSAQTPGFSIGSLGAASIVVNWIALGNASTTPSFTWAQKYPSNANFTSNVTIGAPGMVVQFNDTSVDTPTSWWWNFGDSNVSTSQNPTNKYWTAGLYNVTLTVQKNSINSTITRTSYIAVGQAPSAAFTGTPLTGYAPLNVSFTDQSLYSPTVWNWSWGDSTSNGTTQNPSHIYTNYGNYTVVMTAGNVYGNSTLTKTNYVQAQLNYNQSTLPSSYNPHNVRFVFTDQNGMPLQGLTVTAVPNSVSMPNTWLYQVFGFNQTGVNVAGTTLTATSGGDGSVTFFMVETVQYTVTAINVTTGINQGVTLYPKDSDYYVRITTNAKPNYNSYPTYNLTSVTSADSSTVTLGFNYNDPASQSNLLTFYVLSGGSVVYQNTWPSNTGNATGSYAVTNTRGTIYTWGFNTTQTTYGTVSAWQDITMQGSGPLVNIPGLDANARLGISIMAIIFLAGVFGIGSIKQGAFIVPFVGGGFFWYIGWLPSTEGFVICVCSFVGAVYYMRSQESKAARE